MEGPELGKEQIVAQSAENASGTRYGLQDSKLTRKTEPEAGNLDLLVRTKNGG